MEAKTLATALRSERKKGAARRLRRSGSIPAIVYGHGEPTAISIDAREFRTKFRHVSESTIITLDAGEKKFEVLIKDYQQDVVNGGILHIDFYEIEAGKAVRTNISVHIEGSPKGVREGGILEHPLYELEIECLPKDLPEDMKIDVSGLEIGDSLHVADLQPPEGVTILSNPDQVVALVSTPRAEEEPEAAEEEELAEGEEGVAEEASESGEEQEEE